MKYWIIWGALNNIPPRRQAVIIIYVNGEEGNNNNCLSVKDLPTVDWDNRIEAQALLEEER